MDLRLRSRVPGDEGGGDPARLARLTIEHLAGITPAALEQRAEQCQGLWSGPGSSRWTAALADCATRGRGESSVRPCHTAAGAVGEGGRIARDRQGPQQVGVQDQRRRAVSVGGAWVSARSAPTSSRYCCSAGSASSTTRRSAVSSITWPAV